MIRESDIPALNQLVQTLEKSAAELGDAYEKKDSESFNRLKSLIVQTQRRILGIVKSRGKER